MSYFNLAALFLLAAIVTPPVSAAVIVDGTQVSMIEVQSEAPTKKESAEVQSGSTLEQPAIPSKQEAELPEKNKKATTTPKSHNVVEVLKRGLNGKTLHLEDWLVLALSLFGILLPPPV